MTSDIEEDFLEVEEQEEQEFYKNKNIRNKRHATSNKRSAI